MSFRAFIAAALLLGTASPVRPAAEPKQLSIVKPALRQYEDGPALPAGSSFFTGDLLFYSFQIAGYKVSPEAKIDLHYQIDAVDPDGARLVEPIQHSIETQVSDEDKGWLPIVRESVPLPPLALGGVYRIRVMVEDKLSGQTAKTEIEVPVRGRHVEPSQTVVARNFRFERSEEDRDAILDPVYHPGDTVWAHFEIIGFRYGEKNRIHVEYGVALTDALGKALFSLPQAAVEKDESFYPKRYLPGALSLNLAKDIRPGEYTVVLTLRDEVGKQIQESRQAFRVE
jgi:hypothetical protein